MPATPTARFSPAEPPAISSPNAAFFDLDNTMMRGASLYALARKMYKHQAFSLRQILWFLLHQLRFAARGEKLGDIRDIRDRTLTLAEGFPVAEMLVLAEEIYDEFIESKIWPGTRAIAEQHLHAGRQVWLVTASPVEVASVVARRLGLTGALGTAVEQIDGFYTGRLVTDILHGPAKADAIKALAALEGLDLAQSWGYSDSHNDIPLLESVGHPVAINPDGRLRLYAKRNKWPVYDFRTGRRAATFGLQAVGLSGAVWGLWRSFGMFRHRP